jgi:hypothetical protein
MVARNDARRQKKLAKQKAKRSEKRAKERRRDSKDPTIRLQGAEKWPVVQTLVASDLWKEGIGYVVIARQEGEGRLVFGVFLVDAYCLGVKNAFWDAGSMGDFKELIRKMEQTRSMVPISPNCLVKIIEGAVAYAGAMGFPPHPDHHHASRLFAGIDPASCDQEFSFGRDGKPFYIQGPYETPAEANAIRQRVQEAGGDFLVLASDFSQLDPDDVEEILPGLYEEEDLFDE